MTSIAVAAPRIRRLLPGAGPERILIAVSLLGSVGLGLYQAGSVVFFVRSAGLSAPQVGLGLSAAGFLGLIAGLPIGRLADRIGARRVAIATALIKAVPLTFAVWVHSFWQFLIVVTVLGVADSGWSVANEAVIARMMTGAARIRVSAYLRAVFNIGLTAGSLAAGIALGIGTQLAYTALIWSYVATSLLGAALYLRLPRTPRRPPDPTATPRARVYRDYPYLAVALSSNLTSLGDTILTVGLPLWVITATAAPPQFAGWLLGINTLLVATLQVRAARSAETIRGATRAQEWALVAMVLTCLLAAWSGTVPRWPAIALLVLCVAALSAGEMLGQGARWALRFTLAPADAQGEYGAAFRLGLILPRAVGPLMITALTSHWHLTGWLLLTLPFMLAIAVNRPVIGWAARTRPPVEESQNQ